MALQLPDSMDDILYFTNRSIDSGKAIVWVPKQQCPKCKKAKMGKPAEDGHVKIRAKEYVCPECKYTVEKDQYEETLTCSIKYTCPHCEFSGEATAPYKRKSFMGVPAIIFQCGKCDQKIGITKKMKEVKGKKPKENADDDV